jgi:hypothetical protein
MIRKLAKVKNMICHPRSSPASAIVWSTTWDWRSQVYTASDASVARYTFDGPACSFRPWHIWLRQCDKLAVAEDRLNHDHHIQLPDTKILSTKPGYMGWLITEATKMELHRSNMKDGILLSRSCKPLIHALRKQRTPSPHPQGMINLLTVLFRINSHSPSLQTFGHDNPHLQCPTSPDSIPTERGSFYCWTHDMG